MGSAWDEHVLDTFFKKDRRGSLIFLPFGGKKPGYHIDSPTDEQKIKPFARMYFLGRAMFQILGNTSAMLIALMIMNAHADRCTPIAQQIKIFLVAFLIAGTLFEFLPLWLLWRLYRKSISEICSAMPVAGPEEISQLDWSMSPFRRRALMIFVGSMVLLVGILLVAIARR